MTTGPRNIDNWGGGGGGHIFIYSCYAQLISFEIEIKNLKSIVFTVCEQEYMNMCPPIIDLPPPLSQQQNLFAPHIKTIVNMDDKNRSHRTKSKTETIPKRKIHIMSNLRT